MKNEEYKGEQSICRMKDKENKEWMSTCRMKNEEYTVEKEVQRLKKAWIA